MSVYVVQPGDSIDRIAGYYGISASEIAYANQIPYPYALAIGEALFIPAYEGTGTESISGIPADAENGKRSAVSDGYAYPYISPWVLEQTLPYLTRLLIFSYGFTTEGELLPPSLPVDWMIAAASRYGVQPVLVLTPLGSDGRFNNNLIHEVVRSERASGALIQNLLQEMEENGYQGVDVDFEYILPEDRDFITTFVEKLTEASNEQGKTVSVALAPKTSAGQKGLLYEGKDYAGLGEAADQVLLMTYEWGYTYGPPMAVAPLNKVRQVVEYALTEIPSEKILLGIPNYGYDWTLPYVSGESKAVTIGHVQAVQIAIEQNVPVQFDETARSPWFTYEDERIHEVWFEDVRSLQDKYALVSEYDLKGIGVWQIMRLFRAMWLQYADLFAIV